MDSQLFFAVRQNVALYSLLIQLALSYQSSKPFLRPLLRAAFRTSGQQMQKNLDFETDVYRLGCLTCGSNLNLDVTRMEVASCSSRGIVALLFRDIKYCEDSKSHLGRKSSEQQEEICALAILHYGKPEWLLLSVRFK